MDEEQMNELQEAIENITTAIGAACEMAGLLFKRLLEQGFSRSEALMITKEYLLGMLKGGTK